jgi:hypothetical protein
MQTCKYSLIICVATFMSVAISVRESSAECDPIDYLADDFGSVLLNDRVRTAFFLTATKGQYEKAVRFAKDTLAYGPVTGRQPTFEQAKQAAEKEVQSVQSSYDRQYYVDFLTQQMSVTAADNYASCLESQSPPSSLRAWYYQRKAGFILLRAIWVDTEGSKRVGKLTETKASDLLEIVQIPDAWESGALQQIVVRKKSDGDAWLTLKVDGQQQTFFFLKDSPLPAMTSQVVEGPQVRITSGGTSDGHSPFCQRRAVSSCVVPQKPSGYLLPGSGGWSNLASFGRVGQSVIKDTPEQICVEFWASTGACETEVSISGRATAVERFPQAAK